MRQNDPAWCQRCQQHRRNRVRNAAGVVHAKPFCPGCEAIVVEEAAAASAALAAAWVRFWNAVDDLGRARQEEKI